MTEGMHNPDQIVDPLRLDRCPDCGYLLIGLPEQGICPECGFAYSADMIVLYGWPVRGGLSSIMTPRGLPPDVSPMALVMLVAFLIMMIATYGALFLLSTLLVATPIVGAIVLWRKSRRGDMPGPMQLRLTPKGYATRSGWGPVQLTPWSPRHCIQIFPPDLRIEGRAGRYCCRITTAHTPGFNSQGPHLLGFSFDSTPDAARKIQQRLWDWGLRSL
jgi:hypothetical protein